MAPLERVRYAAGNLDSFLFLLDGEDASTHRQHWAGVLRALLADLEAELDLLSEARPGSGT